MRYDRDGFSVDAAEAKGRPPPEWYDELAILLDEAEEWLMDAFGVLSKSRPVGFGGPAPIPWNLVIQYAEYHTLDRELTDLLLKVVARLDNFFMEWHNKEAEKRNGK